MAEEEKKQDKKIIIDEDWKQQAQKEKDILSAQAKTQPKKPGQARPDRGPFPKGDFAAIISMLTTQALFALGVLKIEGQDKEPDPDLAKFNIDMLEALQEKTKGNLSEQEQKVLQNTLNEVRMAYVKIVG